MPTIANIAIEPRNVTWNSVDLGCIDGDISIGGFDVSSVDVTCHQYGTTVLDKLVNGLGQQTVTMTFKEVTVANLEAFFEDALGGSKTPGGGTKVIGQGTDLVGLSMKSKAAKLVLSPVGATDETGDYCFWLALPKVDTITVSGENPKTVAVTFEIFPDLTKDEKINRFVIGDHTQTLTP